MPVATMFSPRAAAARSAEVRTARRLQREALRGASRREVARAILDPTPELEGYKLQTLFAACSNAGGGVIPLFGTQKLDRALAKLRRQGHSWAHGETKLRHLSTHQRRWLLEAVFERAPKAWGEAA